MQGLEVESSPMEISPSDQKQGEENHWDSFMWENSGSFTFDPSSNYAELDNGTRCSNPFMSEYLQDGPNSIDDMKLVGESCLLDRNNTASLQKEMNQIWETFNINDLDSPTDDHSSENLYEQNGMHIPLPCGSIPNNGLVNGSRCSIPVSTAMPRLEEKTPLKDRNHVVHVTPMIDPSRFIIRGIDSPINSLATASKDYSFIKHASLLSKTRPTNANISSKPSRKRDREDDPSKTEACKGCNCRKSKCLKLYCECFAAGLYCSEPCACKNCLNNPIHEEIVGETRKQIESRNPLAFAPKVIRGPGPSPQVVGDSSRNTTTSARHKTGCNCRKSSCLKKYCECYQVGVGCSISCKCEGCRNSFGRKGGARAEAEEEISVLADSASLEVRKLSQYPLTAGSSYSGGIENFSPNISIVSAPNSDTGSFSGTDVSGQHPPRSSSYNLIRLH